MVTPKIPQAIILGQSLFSILVDLMNKEEIEKRMSAETALKKMNPEGLIKSGITTLAMV